MVTTLMVTTLMETVEIRRSPADRTRE